MATHPRHYHLPVLAAGAASPSRRTIPFAFPSTLPLPVSFPPPAVRTNPVNHRTRWRRRRSSPPRAATSTPPPPPPPAPTRPRAHAVPAPAASAPRPAPAATTASCRRTTPKPEPTRSSTPRHPHLRRSSRRGLLLAPAAGMRPGRTEGASRSRVGDAAGVAGERGRCPSRRSGGTPPRRRRRTVLARSVADEVHPYRCSETDTEARDSARKLQSWRSRHSISESKQRGIGASCSSQGSTTGVAIWQQNHSTVPVDPVLEIPPEFDPDSAEFMSDVSDYATEYRKKDVVEIPLDFDTDAAELDSDARNNAAKQHLEQMEIPLGFDTDASELVSDIWHHEANQQLRQLEAPLEYDPDTSELAPDITEYTIKLKQSHERARKLRADLAVEEQREQELSRMLKGIVTAPNFTETHKKQPRRKSSIERLKVSRHLAEEALNYFEECVSISTMDSTDFSSPEDHQPNSVLNVQPKSNSRFFHKGRSSFQEPHTPADQHGHHEELDKRTQCSISITGSDVSDGVIFSNTKCHMKFRNNSSEDLDGFDTPRSRSSCFSFTHDSIKNVENCDVRQYLGNFGMGNNKELRETRSSYFADDYVSQKVNPDVLKDMATFQNRMQYGGFLICNIRTF
ncbi:uncharacterized protein LOC111258222 isoform X2 [Setaria italica]|uniref:uncharacterized protein LOC111258222 isoform X2 n=1 Tax=Setaria italica TaxID=4555 RepID=UPI000BE57A5C|nr:uncharacterized protein LOC111258222 isoform X2 [Setaria italica]